MSQPSSADKTNPAFEITALVLAAGLSRRFGADNKLTADVRGTTLIRRVVDAVLASSVRRVLVVTGPEGDDVRVALEGLAVSFAINPEPQAGLGRSLAVAVAGALAYGETPAGLMVVPGDMPGLDAALLARLMAAFADAGACRIAYLATETGAQRNPVIWPPTFYERLQRLTGDRGGKHLIADADAPVVVRVGGEALFTDIDTPGDLALFVAGSDDLTSAKPRPK